VSHLQPVCQLSDHLGMVCLYQGALFVRGIVPGLEFGAIGRRVTEPLYDLARWQETGKD